MALIDRADGRVMADVRMDCGPIRAATLLPGRLRVVSETRAGDPKTTPVEAYWKAPLRVTDHLIGPKP